MVENKREARWKIMDISLHGDWNYQGAKDAKREEYHKTGSKNDDDDDLTDNSL